MLVIDLWGPVSVASITGQKYALCAIDPSPRSGWSAVLGLKSKLTAPDAVERLVVFLHNKGWPLRAIRFDQDTVFLSEKMQKMLAGKSVTPTYSTPYFHNQLDTPKLFRITPGHS